MKKRGQISIFIVIGAILLVSASIYLYIDSQREEVAPGVFISVKKIPTELQPANNFIIECLQQTGVRGIKNVGEHGGYISTNDLDITKQSFSITENPTETEAVQFAPGSELHIPYWWYLDGDNKCTGDCSFRTKRPDLREGESSIEQQLNRFIKKEIIGCFNNFQTITEQGFKVETQGELEIDTRIAADDVVVILNYPTTIKKGEINTEVKQFFVRIPVDLESIYNAATQITNLQQEFRFLERQTMNLIAAFSEIDETRLPPMSGMEFEYGTATRWMKSEVKDQVGEILSLYIPLFQVDGSNNFNRIDFSSPLQQRLYDGLIIPGGEHFENLDVTFNYLDFWPLYFDLNCDGEICRPESASSNLLSFAGALMGIQRYNFVYDVSFPTLVEIYEPEALGGQGFKFNFFLESNVRNNREVHSDFQPLETARTPQLSGLCDLSNRNSGNVSVSVYDSVNNIPLNDVSITMNVAGENCFIGKTNEDGMLTTQFPTGTAGAAVSLLRQDYLSKSTLFDAKRNQESNLEAALDPIHIKNVIIVKKLVEKQGRNWVFTNRETSLDPSEEAFVSLTRQSDGTEDEFSTIANIKGDTPSEMRIAPGVYELNINTFSRDYLRIPEKTVKKQVGLFDERELQVPGFEFGEENPFPSGGVRLQVEFTEADLAQDTITFYVVSPALNFVPEFERTIEDLEQVANIDEYSRVFAPILKPIFR